MFPCLSSFGQIDLLSVSEARQIVSLLPEVAASQKRGECPAISLDPGDEEKYLLVEVRGRCSPPGFVGSTLVGKYVVDRLKGEVWRGTTADLGPPVDAPDVRADAKALVLQAGRRALTEFEAQCVAYEAAEDSVQNSGREAITLKKLPPSGERMPRFWIEKRSGGAIRSTWVYVVDARRFTVQEEGLPLDVDSPGVVALLGWLEDMRKPVALSLDEAAQVAEAGLPKSPPVQPDQNRCFEITAQSDDGFGTEQYVHINSRCVAGRLTDEGLLAVDTLTGRLSDPRTGKVVESASAQTVAVRFIMHRAERKAAAQSEVARVCREVPSAR